MAKRTPDRQKAPVADAVVVLSGGQDSALCLALACREYGAEKVAAITFGYGQRHSLETKYARALCRRFGVKRHKVVNLGFYPHITGNALMDPRGKIEKRKGASAPTTLVEGRNAIFLMLAGVWAKGLGARKIYTGVSEADFSGYPDCREEFIRSQCETMRLAMEWPFEIVTPFMHMTKAAEWELADSMGLMETIRTRTLTCYRGIPGDGCGKCPSCRLRNRGLREYLKKKGKKK
ncbi:MAG: 7-cyano-7-deazaguanine synthase QueC [Kiritimatiellae bacterium]|nr:7-cyano-7-deazaguanine synthase QueC [Kiritimatiellia bacterium]